MLVHKGMKVTRRSVGDIEGETFIVAGCTVVNDAVNLVTAAYANGQGAKFTVWPYDGPELSKMAPGEIRRVELTIPD